MRKIHWIFLFFLCLRLNAQTNTLVRGVIMDSNKLGIPFTTVTITNTAKGTVANENGEFEIRVPNVNLQDSLKVSSIGFKTFKVKVEDFIKERNKEIVLVDDTVSLKAVQIFSNMETYLNQFVDNVSNNYLVDKNEKFILFRRFTQEEGKTKFMVEHIVKLFDQKHGRKSNEYSAPQIVNTRKSADYRADKSKEKFFAKDVSNFVSDLSFLDYTRRPKDLLSIFEDWKEDGYTTYEDEEIMILKGTNKMSYMKVYYGLDTKVIYKLENITKTGLKTVFNYKWNADKKMVFDYCFKEYTISKPSNAIAKRKYKKNKIAVTYKHEIIALRTKLTNKNFSVKSGNIRVYGGRDMGEYQAKYSPKLWANINLPPASKFYKQAIKDLESVYHVPIEKQYTAYKFMQKVKGIR